MNNIKAKELKELEKLANKIAKKKERIEAQLKADKELAKWYDDVLKESGLKRPRALIKAMMAHFGISTISLTKSKRGPGRPAKKAAAKPAKAAKGTKTTGAKRKKTKVTAEVRDTVKAAIEGGMSKNAAAKKFGISYLVIKKIEDGAYNSL